MTTKKTTLKSVFLTGLLVLVPLAITLWVLGLVIGTMDQTLLLLPESWQPERVVGFHLPGVGAVLTLAFIFVVGLLTQNFVGQKLVKWWDAMLRHIPVVGPLYTSVKQVSDTLLSTSGNAFRKALLIEYPRRGSYTIAFLTGIPGGDVVNHLERRVRQRLCADYAEPDVRLLPDGAEKRSRRTRHDRRRRAQVHRLDGRRGAVPSRRRRCAARATVEPPL